MIPLFFAADHVNYARWRLYYLCSMEALPDNVHSHFMKGERTIQLSAIPRSWIWSDIGIKVPYNRISKAAAEIIGQSTNMETLKVWPYSLTACFEVVGCLEAMEDESSIDSLHKEEKNPRISYDQVHRDILRKKMVVLLMYSMLLRMEEDYSILLLER